MPPSNEISREHQHQTENNMPAEPHDPIDNLTSMVERAELRAANGDSMKHPRRFSWAGDEDVEILQSELEALHERYR